MPTREARVAPAAVTKCVVCPLTLDDLAENEAEWWEPISIDYRGYEVVTASPPANSFPALVRLSVMGQLDVQSLRHNSAAYLHHYAEVTKHAFWTRLRWAGDPEIAPPPLDRLQDRPVKLVPWLARTHAVTVLPSAASLVMLRSTPEGGAARRAFAGFGDPWFRAEHAVQADPSARRGVALATRGDQSPLALEIRLRNTPGTNPWVAKTITLRSDKFIVLT